MYFKTDVSIRVTNHFNLMCYYPVNSSNSDVLNKNSNNQVQVQWVDFTNSHLHIDRSLTNFLACAQTAKSGRTMLLHVLWLYIFCQRNSGMKNTHSYSWQRHVTHSDMELNIDVTAAVIRHRHTHTHEKTFVHGKRGNPEKQVSTASKCWNCLWPGGNDGGQTYLQIWQLCERLPHFLFYTLQIAFISQHLGDLLKFPETNHKNIIIPT